MTFTRVHIKTFGCRVNQYDSEAMETALAPTCGTVSDDPEVIVLNACTVTALAEKKARQAARQFRRQFPAARIVLVGCLADAVEQGYTRFPDADLLAGNSWKPRIDEVVRRAAAGTKGLLPPILEDERSGMRSAGPRDRMRAFLKIQDGCARSCTYCRATQVRGQPTSKLLADVVEEARNLLRLGFPEIVLTGIDLAQYAPSDGSLPLVLDRVSTLEGLRRLRMGSLNLSGLTDDLLRVCASHPTISPHFHVPLQSGDDRILCAMQRGYDAASYVQSIQRIRHFVPQATFGTDVIIGFPGEDDLAFANTCRVVGDIGFVNLHVFRYSPRRGTAAADLPDPVAAGIKQERCERLQQDWEESLGNLLDIRIGSTQDVLVEDCRESSWRGYTHDYVHVKFPSERYLPVGSIVPVRITGRKGAILEGVDDQRVDAC